MIHKYTPADYNRAKSVPETSFVTWLIVIASMTAVVTVVLRAVS